MKSLMRLRPSLLLTCLLAFCLAVPLFAAENPVIFPLRDVHAGMKGVAYTIFTGDQIEKMDVTVLGVLKNAMGPKQDIILVELSGADVAKTGVVAGMSGSPVYFDGKLAGAVSLKIGTFNKDAIAGVTPIQNMLDIQKAMAAPSGNDSGTPAAAPVASQSGAFPERVPLGDGKFLVPIETPLIFSGVMPQTLALFGNQFQAFGMSAMAGGTTAARPDDAELKPGDMVGMNLVSGDLALYAGCSVTAIVGDEVFVCGHPLFSFGSVALPMTRAHVVTTLASSLESTKIMNSGGPIGTIVQDRVTAVVGRLGASPPTLPVDVNVTTPSEQRHFHFNVAQNPKLTPLLVAVATLNGITANTAYTEGTTLELDGHIDIAGHPSVELRDMYNPSDTPVPDGYQLAVAVQAAFARIYTNPYEQPKVKKVTLNVTSRSENRWSTIDGAWSDTSEVQPGETIHIKVLLRPYRGAPFIQEVPLTIPAQAARGDLQILVSDASSLNRMRELFPGAGSERLQSLDELIRVINRERQNDHLYVTLLQNSPTLLVEDKELPNVPASAVNILDQHRVPGAAHMLFQSVIGEHSVGMTQVITGQQYLSIRVK
ncbi:MAG TPA: SpoIVB peptidase S55 domain-containing protein [Candidatus Acidoferrales bacterium]|nr:SpoIVB peptidase S55 domain-containing protein [Candidatus Acidoferrales bacterium]